MAAAGLKDLQFSQSGEQKVQTPFSEFEQIHLGEPQQLAPDSGRIILKLAGPKKNGRVWLDGIDDVINPTTGKKERIRLINGVETVWQNEQKDLDKEYISKNRRSLRFEDMVCVIDPTDTSAIKFSELSNCSMDNKKAIPGKKHRFFRWNPAAQEKAALEKELLEIEVMQLAMDQPFEKVKKHASFLGGISFVDEMGEPRTEKGIRTLYVRKAKQDPERFKKTLESKEVEVSYLIKRAIIDAKIDLGGVSRSISWANGGGFICKMPIGREAHEYLLEFALLPTEEGKQFLERLQKV